jgi:hypothetical protein
MSDEAQGNLPIVAMVGRYFVLHGDFGITYGHVRGVTVDAQSVTFYAAGLDIPIFRCTAQLTPWRLDDEGVIWVEPLGDGALELRPHS